MRVRGERQGGTVGFGWRLVAFDPATRSGEVAVGARVLRFESAAAADEDLRLGDEVFVRLLSSAPSEPHVACVWPCLTRLSTPEGAELCPAPTLTARIAEDAERMLAALPRVDAVLAVMAGEGSLRLALFDLDRNAYGIAGHDLTVYGALCCTGVRHGPPRELGHPVVLRLADDVERAWAHAERALAPETLVLAMVDRRDELSPVRGQAAVVLVSCDRITWQPGPPRSRLWAAEEAVMAALRRGLDVVTVDDGRLMGRVHGRLERLLALAGPAETAAFEPWCDAVSWLLRDMDDGVRGGSEIAAALLSLEQEIERSEAPFARLPVPGIQAPEPAVLVPLLVSIADLLDAFAAWLESLARGGISVAPPAAAVPALAARIGRIAEHHGDLVRRGALQSPAWHATIDLYDEYAYCGSTHGGGALLSRLHDGRPLRPGDTETLRALAARARSIASGLEHTAGR